MKSSIKTLALLIIAIGIAVFLLSTKNSFKVPSPTSFTAEKQTILRFSPNPTIISGPNGKTDIAIDTGGDTVNFVQIKVTYNPNLVYGVHIEKGSFFSSAQILNNYVDDTSGTATFILSLPKKAAGKNGKGTIATVQFKTSLKNNETTLLSFSPETMVSGSVYTKSVLKNSIDTKIIRKDNP
jgi:hypothetical protein